VRKPSSRVASCGGALAAAKFAFHRCDFNDIEDPRLLLVLAVGRSFTKPIGDWSRCRRRSPHTANSAFLAQSNSFPKRAGSWDLLYSLSRGEGEARLRPATRERCGARVPVGGVGSWYSEGQRELVSNCPPRIDPRFAAKQKKWGRGWEAGENWWVGVSRGGGARLRRRRARAIATTPGSNPPVS